MENEESGTITLCIERARLGVPEAAAILWHHYRRELERAAHDKLRKGAHTGAREEAEDAALSAFVRLHDGLGRGRFLGVGGRVELGRLLRKIVVRRSLHRLRSTLRRKRGGDLTRCALDADHVSAGGLTPADLVDGEDAATALLNILPDDTLRLIVRWRLDGYTDGEIAERLGCTRVTIQRKLRCIRTIWEARNTATAKVRTSRPTTPC